MNIYLIEADTGPVLVDAGWFGAAGERALSDGLRRIGYTFADITRIYVTHAHYDHYSLALSLRARFGCPISLGREERHTVEVGLDPTHPIEQRRLLVRCGAVPDLVEHFVSVLRRQELPDELPWGAPDEWLRDGDRIDLGGRVLDVVETPGHTRGHVVLRDTDHGLLFSGDHVLPHITPSIGFERVPEPMPMRSFLNSLRLVRELPDALLLPAHGPVTSSVHERVDQLLAHHQDRLSASLRGVAGGADTALTVAAGMTWTNQDRPFEDLDVLHQGMAAIEVGAHLDLLTERGLLTAQDDGAVRYYAVA